MLTGSVLAHTLSPRVRCLLEVPVRVVDDRLYEYACHEGNYSLSSVLSGARYQERLEAQGASDSRRN